jgi:regulator of nucleoside diphosphate kinase
MNHDTSMRARPLPAIAIPTTDYDRLADLAAAAPRALAHYIRRELERAAIVPDDEFDARAARVGSRVTYRDDTSGRTRTVTLAWPRDADVADGRISVLTAIGAALLGMRANASIDWPAPLGGPRRLTVLGVDDGRPGPTAA